MADIFHQLHAADLIAQDPEDRDRWILTGAGRAMLKGEAPLALRGELPLPGGRKADLRRTLEEIEALRAEGPAARREAFTPIKQAARQRR
jgi:ATP-dependent DNA helicase RecQ